MLKKNRFDRSPKGHRSVFSSAVLFEKTYKFICIIIKLLAKVVTHSSFQQHSAMRHNEKLRAIKIPRWREMFHDEPKISHKDNCKSGTNRKVIQNQVLKARMW